MPHGTRQQDWVQGKWRSFYIIAAEGDPGSNYVGGFYRFHPGIVQKRGIEVESLRWVCLFGAGSVFYKEVALKVLAG